MWSVQTGKLESSFPTYEGLEDVLVLDAKDPKVSVALRDNVGTKVIG